MPATGTPTVHTRTVRYRADDLNMVGVIRIEASLAGSQPRPYHGNPDGYSPDEYPYIFDAEYIVEWITETFYDDDGKLTSTRTFTYPHDDGHIIDSDRVNSFLVDFHNSDKCDEIMYELECEF